MQLLSFQDRQGEKESRLEMQPGQQYHRKPVELVIYNIFERNWSTQKHPYGKYISADWVDRSRVWVCKFSPSSTPNVHELWSIIMYCYMSWSLVDHYIQIRIVLLLNHNFDILVNDRLKKLAIRLHRWYSCRFALSIYIQVSPAACRTHVQTTVLYSSVATSTQ